MIVMYWKGKKVLVTGGAGFIGSHLVKILVKKGAVVRVADNLSRGRIENLSGVLDEIEFRKVDLTKETHCLDACKGTHTVFHLAASVGGIEYLKKASVGGCVPSILMNTHMLEASVKCGVDRFLFASSACVYHAYYEGREVPVHLREEDAYPALPHTTYGWAKLLGEIQCDAYFKDYGLKTSVTRLFSVYGENENLDPRWSHVIPSLIRKAIRYPNEPFVVFGDGTQTRAFLYVEDAVQALLLAVEKYPKPNPLNIGSGEWIKIEDLIEKIVDLSGKKIEIKYDFTKPTGAHGYCANYQKAREILGWEPKVSLEVGLKRTYEWAKQELGHE